MWHIKCIWKCYLHWCSGNWNRILASDRPHPLGMTKEARSGTSAAYRFPSTTSMRSSAVESLRRVMSALWILYSARMLFTVSPSSSLCAHWREKKGGEGWWGWCQSIQQSKRMKAEIFYTYQAPPILYISHTAQLTLRLQYVMKNPRVQK